MKKTLSVAVWLALSVSLRAAPYDAPTGHPSPSEAITSTGVVSSTPEMWLYTQEQSRHDDSQKAVRRKAEYQAAQRVHRLESARWYGYNALQPIANPTPVMGEYSTRWVNSPCDPMKWRAAVPGEQYARWVWLY